jgi:hypothetical protein
MSIKTEHPFTAEQFQKLEGEEQKAVLAVAEYLTSRDIEITDEELSQALNLMKVTDGCVPSEEVGDDLLASIRRKFAAVYETAMELAEAELKANGLKIGDAFNFCLLIEPSYEDRTHIAILDYDKPICYLHDWSKAWHLVFENLADLAQAVLAAKAALVKLVVEGNRKEIFVVVEGGVVREIVNLPEHLRVTVLDYDLDGVEKERIGVSPVDGEPCVINRW